VLAVSNLAVDRSAWASSGIAAGTFGGGFMRRCDSNRLAATRRSGFGKSFQPAISGASKPTAKKGGRRAFCRAHQPPLARPGIVLVRGGRGRDSIQA
jgi:hypothetical protein